MTSLPPSLERLATLTTRLADEVPSLRGLLPDLDDAAELLRASEGRRATYALGTIKSGKSTLVSALVGADVLPRGSGVKTFNVTRLAHDDARSARIAFKTPAQLGALIRFDLRMIGCLGEAPADPYAPGAGAALAHTFRSFEDEARADGRLARIESHEGEAGLLALSLARLRHVTRSLEQIPTRHGDAVLATIQGRSELRFVGDAFERYLDWANVMEHAALIQEIELTLPFPPTLSPREALVDCQGSDSLNPLDFASVDAALHRADRVVYVVNSRLGMRHADRHLVKHLAASGLAAKARFVLNVEAFEPLPAAELAALEQKLRQDLAALGVDGAAVYLLSALHELNRRKGEPTFELVRQLWRDRGHAAVLASLEDGFGRLETDLGRLAAGEADQSEARLAALTASRVRRIAEGVLSRDRDVHGVQGTDLVYREVKDAVGRIVEGERATLKKTLDRLAQEAYDSHGPIQREIDQFLAVSPEAYAKAQPLPDTLRTASRHGEVMAAALERFNADWTLLDQKLRVTIVHPLIERAFAEIRRTVEHLYKVVPGIVGARFAEAGAEVLPSLAETLTHAEAALDRFRTQTDVPETLAPVVLVPHLASGLAAEFYARHWASFLKGKLTKAKQDAAPVADARKIATLWTRTIKQAHKAARQDQEFSVSSARENVKFMYVGRAAEAALAAFQEVMLAGIASYYDDLERLRAQRSLLLTGEDRKKLEAWLAAM